MANIKISQLPVLANPVDTTKIPVVDGGGTKTISASSMATYVSGRIPWDSVLPTATTSVLGGVKVDGSTIVISGTGVISSQGGYSLPTASTTVTGGVRVDGTSITIASGVITASTSSLVNGVHTLSLGTNGKLTAPGNLQVDGGKIILHPYGNAYVESVDYGVNSANSAVNIFGGPYQKIKLRAGFGTEATWTFGTDGTTTFPTNISINYSGGNVQFPRIIADSGKAFSVQGQGASGSAALAWTVDPNAAGQYAQIGVTKNGGDNLAKVILTAQSNSSNAATAKTWKFNETGNLTLPAGSIINESQEIVTVTLDQFTAGGFAGTQVFTKVSDTLYELSPTGPYMTLISNVWRLKVGPATYYDSTDLITWSPVAVALPAPVGTLGTVVTTNLAVGGDVWGFDGNGALTLPAGGVISEGGGFTGAIRLTPAGGANAYQSLVIYPTAAAPDGDHLHLTAGGGTTELYLGNDNHYVKLVDGGDVEVQASTGDLSSRAVWTFDTDGNIDTRQALGIKVPNGVPSSVTDITMTTASWELNPRSNLATTGGSGTGLTVNITETDGYVTAIAIATAGTGYTAGDYITVTSGTSSAAFIIAVAGRNTWLFGTAGSITFPNNSVQATAYLGTASPTQIGGVLVPAVGTSGITNTTGTIGLATASNSQLGGVKVDASSITINGSGIISVPAVATIGLANGIATLGNDGTLTAGQIPSSAVVTGGSYSDPSWLTLTASKVGLGSVTNESKATMFASPTFTGTVTLQQLTEVLNTKTSATGTVAHDLSTGVIFYHSSISANFTANFTNVPTTNDRTLAVVLVLNQGATAYLPTAVQIDGVAQTILWQGTVLPVGTTSRVNVVSFTLVRTGSAWTVIGALTTYGAV